MFQRTDILGRIGGDEFMILKNIESEISAAYKAAKILRYINNVHNVTASAELQYILRMEKALKNSITMLTLPCTKPNLRIRTDMYSIMN